MRSTTRRARASSSSGRPRSERSFPTKASRRVSVPAASPISEKNTSTDAGCRAIARSTSRQITLPEPSQIEFSGVSRYSRGMPDSST